MSENINKHYKGRDEENPREELSKDLLKKYKQEIKRINDTYDKQAQRIQAQGGHVANNYHLVDMSAQVRTNEELEDLYHQLGNQTITARNTRLQQNYVNALRRNDMNELADRIEKLGPNAFFHRYAKLPAPNVAFNYYAESLQEEQARNDVIEMFGLDNYAEARAFLTDLEAQWDSVL